MKMRRFAFRCRGCKTRWVPRHVRLHQHCPHCKHQRVDVEEDDSSGDAGEPQDLLPDDEDLIAQRAWTDRNGRSMTARLRTVAKNTQGYFEGFFIRDDGVGFQYQIGNLAPDDVALVRQTMIDKDLYDADEA